MHFLTGVCAIVGGIFTGKALAYFSTFLILCQPLLIVVFISSLSYLGVFFFFSVAGLIDSMIYHSSRALQKKIDLGKAT